MRHDQPVEVTVLSAFGLDQTDRFVQFETEFGTVTARWHGDAAGPGDYSVEFALERGRLRWGYDLCPATAQDPAIYERGGKVVMCGLLEVAADGDVNLRLGNSITMLGQVEGLPMVGAGVWAELLVDRDDLVLYPYDS